MNPLPPPHGDVLRAMRREVWLGPAPGYREPEDVLESLEGAPAELIQYLLVRLVLNHPELAHEVMLEWVASTGRGR